MEYAIVIMFCGVIVFLMMIWLNIRRFNTTIINNKPDRQSPSKMHFTPLKKRDKLPLEERQRRTIVQNIERYNGSAEGQAKLPKE